MPRRREGVTRAAPWACFLGAGLSAILAAHASRGGKSAKQAPEQESVAAAINLGPHAFCIEPYAFCIDAMRLPSEGSEDRLRPMTRTWLTSSQDPAKAAQTTRETVGKRLTQIREGIAMSQTAMADLLGVNQGTISRWERGLWKGESIPRVYLLIYSVLDGRRIPELTAPRLNDDDTGFQQRQKSDEDKRRSFQALDTLGLLDPEIAKKLMEKLAFDQAASPIRPEKPAVRALIDILFDALNGRPTERGYGFLVNGVEVLKVRTRTRTLDHHNKTEMEIVARARTIAWE